MTPVIPATLLIMTALALVLQVAKADTTPAPVDLNKKFLQMRKLYADGHKPTKEEMQLGKDWSCEKITVERTGCKTGNLAYESEGAKPLLRLVVNENLSRYYGGDYYNNFLDGTSIGPYMAPDDKSALTWHAWHKNWKGETLHGDVKGFVRTNTQYNGDTYLVIEGGDCGRYHDFKDCGPSDFIQMLTPGGLRCDIYSYRVCRVRE